MKRQKLEDNHKLNWQSEEKARMEEETEQIGADAKKTIDINLIKNQQMVVEQKLLMETDGKEYLHTEVQAAH